MNAIYQEKYERCKKAILNEKPDRVPITCKIMPEYAIQYAGYSLKEGLWDLDKYVMSLNKLYEDFYFDAGGFNLRNPLFYQALGSTSFIPSKEGYMQKLEIAALMEDEYDEYIKDPYKCCVEKVLPRLYSGIKPGSQGQMNFTKGLNQFGQIMARTGQAGAQLAAKFGTVSIRKGAVYAPFDFMMSNLRGFKGITIDVKRRPEKIMEAIEATIPMMVKFVKLVNPVSEDPIPSIFMPLMMPSFMRTKEFEKYFYPSFKKLAEILAAEGYTIQMFFEKNWSRYYDFLKELPKNKIVGHFEEDDLGEVKKALGDRMCIMGNFPATMLQTESTERCIDIAKEILDKAAPGGGYFFTFDKSLLLLKDGPPDKVKAVLDFVKSYGVYK